MTQAEYIALAIRLYDGGFTVDVDGNPPPDDGYMVSLPGHECVGLLKPGRTTAGGIADWIYRYVIEHGRALRDPGCYLGGWRDGGRLVLDVSIRLADRAAAIALAHAGNQDAIYDLSTGETIASC